MLYTIVVMIKRRTCVVWWINKDTSNLSCKLLLQCLQRQQIVPMYQYIVENVMLTHPVRRMVRLL